MKSNKVLVLRKTNENLKSYNGFEYPRLGKVETLDWKDDDNCGGGLHGLEWGVGNFDIRDYGTLFQVIKVNKDKGYVDLGDKVKFRKGKVILTTESQEEAINLILKHAHNDVKDKINFQNQVGGNSSTQTAGGYSTQTAGGYSTQTAGGYSTQTAGDNSTQTAGDSSTQTAWGYSTQTAWGYSTQTAGGSSTQKAGGYSTQTAGDNSTQTAGDSSTQTAWGYSTQTAGDNSTQTAGGSSTQTAGNSSFHNIIGTSAIIKPSKHSVITMIEHNKSKVFTYENDFQDKEILKIKGMQIEKRYTTTPDNITKLEDFEIFIFGSNLNGNHGAGSAKLARDKFGAIDKQGEGLQGQSYAFPTLDKDMNKLSLDDLQLSIEKLIKTTNENTTKIFLLTKVGCGIAGFNEDEIRPLFKDTPANIVKPFGW